MILANAQGSAAAGLRNIKHMVDCSTRNSRQVVNDPQSTRRLEKEFSRNAGARVPCSRSCFRKAPLPGPAQHAGEQVVNTPAIAATGPRSIKYMVDGYPVERSKVPNESESGTAASALLVSLLVI